MKIFSNKIILVVTLFLAAVVGAVAQSNETGGGGSGNHGGSPYPVPGGIVLGETVINSGPATFPATINVINPFRVGLSNYYQSVYTPGGPSGSSNNNNTTSSLNSGGKNTIAVTRKSGKKYNLPKGYSVLGVVAHPKKKNSVILI